MRLVRGAIALADKLVPSSSTSTRELLVVGITAPTLVVLAAWLGSAQGLPPQLNLVAVTILGLALVTPFMLREMHSSTQTETDDILFIAPTNRAEDVSNSSGHQDSEGWSGQMVNLSSDEIEFLSDLVGEYLEFQDGLSQPEWGFAQGLMDKLDEALNES